MLNFYFWDRAYSFGPYKRESAIKVNNITVVLTLEKENNWRIYFYNENKSSKDNDGYIVDYSISEKLALKIINEAKEYQSFLYDSNSY